jgi:hypothetical protein
MTFGLWAKWIMIALISLLLLLLIVGAGYEQIMRKRAFFNFPPMG